jgi:hypothetical protein
MTGTRSQTGQTIAMKQLVHGIQRVRNAELLLQNAYAVLATQATHAAIAIDGPRFESFHELLLQLT